MIEIECRVMALYKELGGCDVVCLTSHRDLVFCLSVCVLVSMRVRVFVRAHVRVLRVSVLVRVCMCV